MMVAGAVMTIFMVTAGGFWSGVEIKTPAVAYYSSVSACENAKQEILKQTGVTHVIIICADR